MTRPPTTVPATTPGTTALPQAVLAPLSESAVFVTLTVHPGGEDAVADLLADYADLARSVGFRVPAEELSAVVGISSGLWDRLFDGPRPAHLHPFAELRGARHHAPSTPGDLFLHLRARRMHPCFELASLVTRRLAEHVEVVDEVHGFRYFDCRDLLGFVDGTANPTDRAAATAAVIDDADPPFVGGSYVTVQKYLHDLSAWNALSVEEQERAIGRRKLDDVELTEKAPTAHSKLAVVHDEDGAEVDILRDNMPFGSVAEGEYGTYFIGYSADPSITERMLRNMFVGDPEGTTDRILDFSRAVTGAQFFVPSQDLLDDLPPRRTG